MTKLFAGKVALVTGGSSGIGRATALLFAREGAKVVVADVEIEGGQETVRLIREGDGEALFAKADVSQAAESSRPSPPTDGWTVHITTRGSKGD